MKSRHGMQFITFTCESVLSCDANIFLKSRDFTNTSFRADLWTVIQKLCLLSKFVVLRSHKCKYEDQRQGSHNHAVISSSSPADVPYRLTSKTCGCCINLMTVTTAGDMKFVTMTWKYHNDIATNCVTNICVTSNLLSKLDF